MGDGPAVNRGEGTVAVYRGENEPLSLGCTLRNAPTPGPYYCLWVRPQSQNHPLLPIHRDSVHWRVSLSWMGGVFAHREREVWPDFKLSVLTPGLSPDAQRLGWVGAQAFLAASLSACGQRGRRFPKPHRCEELVTVVFVQPY